MRKHLAIVLWCLCVSSLAISDSALQKSTSPTIATTRITTITKLSTTRVPTKTTKTTTTTSECPYFPTESQGCHTTCPRSTVRAGSQSFTKNFVGCQVEIYPPEFVVSAMEYLDYRLPDCGALEACAYFATLKRAPDFVLTFFYDIDPCGYHWLCRVGSFPPNPLYRPAHGVNLGLYAYRSPDSTSTSATAIASSS